MNCTSCNTHITAAANFTTFKCPKCGEQDIVRCKTCRDNSVKYICVRCAFEGP